MPKQTDKTQEGLNTRPTVAITMGDPCGVGPEIIVKAFDSPGFAGECSALVVGDRLPIERAIRLLGSSAVVLPDDRSNAEVVSLRHPQGMGRA